MLIGGYQTPVFTYDGASFDVTLHDNTDSDCSGEIVADRSQSQAALALARC